MKIPKQVKIGGITYKITVSDKLLHIDNRVCKGTIDYENSIIEINNINGLFMFIEYSYNTDSNITSGKLQQFFKDEVPDLEYALTFDYGETVKPSIRS